MDPHTTQHAALRAALLHRVNAVRTAFLESLPPRTSAGGSSWTTFAGAMPPLQTSLASALDADAYAAFMRVAPPGPIPEPAGELLALMAALEPVVRELGVRQTATLLPLIPSSLVRLADVLDSRTTELEHVYSTIEARFPELLLPDGSLAASTPTSDTAELAALRAQVSTLETDLAQSQQLVRQLQGDVSMRQRNVEIAEARLQWILLGSSHLNHAVDTISRIVRDTRNAPILDVTTAALRFQAMYDPFNSASLDTTYALLASVNNGTAVPGLRILGSAPPPTVVAPQAGPGAVAAFLYSTTNELRQMSDVLENLGGPPAGGPGIQPRIPDDLLVRATSPDEWVRASMARDHSLLHNLWGYDSASAAPSASAGASVTVTSSTPTAPPVPVAPSRAPVSAAPLIATVDPVSASAAGTTTTVTTATAVPPPSTAGVAGPRRGTPSPPSALVNTPSSGGLVTLAQAADEAGDDRHAEAPDFATPDSDAGSDVEMAPAPVLPAAGSAKRRSPEGPFSPRKAPAISGSNTLPPGHARMSGGRGPAKPRPGRAPRSGTAPAASASTTAPPTPSPAAATTTPARQPRQSRSVPVVGFRGHTVSGTSVNFHGVACRRTENGAYPNLIVSGAATGDSTIQHNVYLRWKPSVLQDFMDTEPWKRSLSWRRWLKRLVMFDPRDWPSELREIVGRLLILQELFEQEYWERYHWMALPKPDSSTSSMLSEIYTDRKYRCQLLMWTFSLLMAALDAGYEARKDQDPAVWWPWKFVLWEPALWFIPPHPCVIIPPATLMDTVAKLQSCVDAFDQDEPLRLQLHGSAPAFASIGAGTLPDVLLQRLRDFVDDGTSGYALPPVRATEEAHDMRDLIFLDSQGHATPHNLLRVQRVCKFIGLAILDSIPAARLQQPIAAYHRRMHSQAPVTPPAPASGTVSARAARATSVTDTTTESLSRPDRRTASRTSEAISASQLSELDRIDDEGMYAAEDVGDEEGIASEEEVQESGEEEDEVEYEEEEEWIEEVEVGGEPMGQGPSAPAMPAEEEETKDSERAGDEETKESDITAAGSVTHSATPTPEASAPSSSETSRSELAPADSGDAPATDSPALPPVSSGDTTYL